PQSESEARKNMIAYLKNTEGFKMAFFNGKTYDQIRPIFQARLREQAKEAEDLKKQLEVVADEDDDMFVEATPIGTKSNVNAARLELKLFRDAAVAAHMK
nr:hypothetical protein [Tanacetum cinerariifolium]